MFEQIEIDLNAEEGNLEPTCNGITALSEGRLEMFGQESDRDRDRDTEQAATLLGMSI